MAVAAHHSNGKIAVAFGSDMVRVYEPQLRPIDETRAEALAEKRKVEEKTQYSWSEQGGFRCQLVQHVAFDSFPGNENPLIACASADSTLKVFDQKGLYCTHNFRGHNGPVTYCRFENLPIQNGQKRRMFVYSAGQDCTIKVWNLLESKLQATLTGHLSQVTEIDFFTTPEGGRRMVSGGRDKVLNVWDLDKFSLIYTIPVYEPLESVVVLPKDLAHPRHAAKDLNSKAVYVLTAGESGLLKIWDLVAKQIVHQQQNNTNPLGIDYTVLDVENSRLLVVTNDQNIIIHRTEDLQSERTIVGFNDEIIDIKYLTNAELVAATNSEQVRAFTLPDFSCRVFGQNQPDGVQHKDIVLCVAISKDGRFVASGSKDQKIIIWDAKSGKSLLQLVGHAADVTCLTFFNKTSRYLVSGSKDLTWKIWDLAHESEDETESSSSVRIIDSSVVTMKAHNKDINAVTVAPTDGMLATAGQDKIIKLYKLGGADNVTAVQEIGTLMGHRRGVWDVAFSPVDKVLATASGDKTIKLWSLSDFSCLKTFEGHTATILRLHFITSGLQLVSAGADGLIKLWNVSNSECINTFDQHTEKIWGLAVRSDGEEFVSGGGDSVINLWKDSTVEEAEKELKAKESSIIAEQNLSNSLRMKDYSTALRIAFKLDKPFRILQVFEQVLDEESEARFCSVIAEFTPDLVEKLVMYIRDWNTNAKHSLIAQKALGEILRLYSAESLSKMPRIKEVLQALLPYTQRHFQRIDRLIESSFIIDYALQSMSFLDDEPIEETPDRMDVDESVPSSTDLPAEFQNAVEDVAEQEAEEEPLEEEKPSVRKKRRLSSGSNGKSKDSKKKQQSKPKHK
jgi:U3 small nucleolar RNA-associated protein 13